TIVMQIHGRLTEDQRDLIGEDDNDAPPLLKIYVQNNKVRVVRKILVDPQATGEAILQECLD
ncbi:MAG: polysaccharide lyase family 7 protein, partial [Cyclobacteriaceae bacterium]